MTFLNSLSFNLIMNFVWNWINWNHWIWCAFRIERYCSLEAMKHCHIWFNFCFIHQIMSRISHIVWVIFFRSHIVYNVHPAHLLIAYYFHWIRLWRKFRHEHDLIEFNGICYDHFIVFNELIQPNWTVRMDFVDNIHFEM